MKFFTLIDHGFSATVFGLSVCWLPMDFDDAAQPEYTYRHVEVEVVLPFYYVNFVLCYNRKYTYNCM